MSRLSKIQTYACYYGRGRVEQLRLFDLLILQPAAYRPEELIALGARGALVIAYLSLGEEPKGTASASALSLRSPHGDPYDNPEWSTVCIDTRKRAWRQLLVEERIPPLRRRFDGLFLDTIDVQQRFPALRESVIELVRGIRDMWPDAVLVVNRGFDILDRVAPVVDGVMFESYSSYFRDGQYHDWQGADRAYNDVMADRLGMARTRHPFTTLALDYAHPADHARIARSTRRAHSAGFIPCVSTFDLQEILGSATADAASGAMPGPLDGRA